MRDVEIVFHLGALILNKTLPDYLLDPAAETAADALRRDSAALGEALASTYRARVPGARFAGFRDVSAEAFYGHATHTMSRKREGH